RLHPLGWSAALLVAGAVAIFASPASADLGTAADCKDPSAHCIPSGQVTLTLSQTGTQGGCRFDGTIDWGDGHTDSSSSTQDTTARHTWAAAGVYDLGGPGTAPPTRRHTPCRDTLFRGRGGAPAPSAAAPRAPRRPAPPATSVSRHPARKIRTRGRLVKVTF